MKSCKSLSTYQLEIESLLEAQPNKELLQNIRSFNHEAIDVFDSIDNLKGNLLLDVGASPHGFALERALGHKVAMYVGIGLDILEPEYVSGPIGNIGTLFCMDAGNLRFPDSFFDSIITLSTFEHFLDGGKVLNEFARVLKPKGKVLVTFEPIWSCSHGHHLHHFGECAKLVPPWSHLVWTEAQMREKLLEQWPSNAPITLEQAIHWVYSGSHINRLNILQLKEMFRKCPLSIEWMVDLKEEPVDETYLQSASERMGINASDLRVKGMSILLTK